MNFTIRFGAIADGKAQVFIDGDMIVRDAADVKTQLLNILHTYSEANIHLQNTSRIDVAGLQLLLALSKSAVMANKSFQFYTDGSTGMQDLLKTSGYSHLFKNQ